MRKYIKFIACCGLLISQVSCNNQLDLESDGHINMDGVFAKRSTTIAYLTNCYGYCQGVDLSVSSLTDEAYDSRILNAGSLFDWWYNKGMTIENYSSYDGNPWTNYFIGIRKCNVFLEKIKNYGGYATQGELEGWIAQAHCLRAYYYLQLIKRYGEVPLILTDMATTGGSYSDVRKSKVGEVVKQIIEDCDKALSAKDDELGFSWNVQDYQETTFKRATAYAIKSEAILYAVSPLFDDGTFTWNDAVKITGDALYQCLTHDYSLWTIEAPDQAQNAYAYYFLFKPWGDKRNLDKESILTLNGTSVWNTCGLPTTEGQEQAGVCPSQELVDAYGMANGELAITGYEDSEHLQPIINPNSGYDVKNPYANRDPRFYASIYYNGAVKMLDQPDGYKIETFEDGAEGISQKDVKHTPTGYYLRKYNSYKSSKLGNSDGYIRVFRLAELYMNFAEAAYMAINPDTKVAIGEGMSISALDAVNKIRQRAGVPDFCSGMTKEEFQKRYRNERRIEFAFEGQRFFDVRRWKVYDDNFSIITGMKILKEGDSFNYQRFGFTARASIGDKYLLYPLDNNEVNKMIKLTGTNWQNPGW